MMKTQFSLLAISTFVVSLGLFATAGDANAAIYVKIPGLQGDVTTKGYEGYFTADSFSFGVEREMKESGEKGGTEDINIGVGELQECTITKSIDNVSAGLAQFAINGNSLGTAEIEFVEVGEDDGKATTYLKYKLDRAFVKSWSTSGEADDRPTEEVAFYYNDITIIREREDKEPSSGKPTEFGILKEHPKTNEKTTTDEDIPTPQPRIPNWVQSIATFWADGDVTDKEFTVGMGYLVKEGIIEIDEESINSETNRKVDSAEKDPEIPEWVKQNTKWWTTGEISEEQFLENIKWLIKNNIIKGISNQ